METSAKTSILFLIALISLQGSCREENPDEIVIFEELTYVGSEDQRAAESIDYQKYYPGMDKDALKREYFIEMFTF